MSELSFKKVIESIQRDELTPLSEAAFSANKLRKVSDLLASVLGKDLGGGFEMLGGSLGQERTRRGSWFQVC